MSRVSNSVRLIGNLGQDPETRTLESGNVIAKFSIATSDKYTNKAGETVEQTEWHNIVAFGKLAEICGKYLKKGKKVAIEGKLKHRQYDAANGVRKYITEIEARDMEMLSTKSEAKPANGYPV